MLCSLSGQYAVSPLIVSLDRRQVGRHAVAALGALNATDAIPHLLAQLDPGVISGYTASATVQVQRDIGDMIQPGIVRRRLAAYIPGILGRMDRMVRESQGPVCTESLITALNCM